MKLQSPILPSFFLSHLTLYTYVCRFHPIHFIDGTIDQIHFHNLTAVVYQVLLDRITYCIIFISVGIPSVVDKPVQSINTQYEIFMNSENISQSLSIRHFYINFLIDGGNLSVCNELNLTPTI